MTSPTRPVVSANVCVVAGEASGDLQASLLIRSLQEELTEAQQPVHFWGVAGPLMRQQGVECVLPLESLAVMGLAEVLESYHRISQNFHQLLHEIRLRRPRAVILVDFPGFNLRLAERLNALGISVIYHIPPKVWAHGLRRVFLLKQCTQLVTCILPFEEKFLRGFGVPAVFVGNPLRDAVAAWSEQQTNMAPPPQAIVGLIPGSRKMELKYILPALLDAFVLLCTRHPHRAFQAHLPVATTLSLDFVLNLLRQHFTDRNLPLSWMDRIAVSSGDAYRVMAQAEYAWVGSGTATLEACFLGTPMSVVYRMNALSYFIAKRLVKTKYISLVNLCAEELLVPEFIQEQMNPQILVTHAESMIFNSERCARFKAQLLSVRALFQPGSITRAAHTMAQRLMEL